MTEAMPIHGIVTLRRDPAWSTDQIYGLDSICCLFHHSAMIWTVLFHPAFDLEFAKMPEALQDELLAHALLLREFGPQLGRPTVDTLKGSAHPNMKELRFDWEGQPWRTAFAFDRKRRAILLAAGGKSGANQRRFYGKLIRAADTRFEEHLRGVALLANAVDAESKDGKKS